MHTCLKCVARGSLKYRTQNWRKNRHLRTIAQLRRLYLHFTTKACINNRKKLVKQQYVLHMSAQYGNFGPLTEEIGSGVWGTPGNFNGFASCLRYCSDVAHRRPTKLCTMFGVSWAGTLYIHFRGLLPPWQNFSRCKIHFTSKSCVRLYWQRYCTALQQRASAKLCGVVQGMELRNFRRGRHLYSAGRPSRWASAHILVCQ